MKTPTLSLDLTRDGWAWVLATGSKTIAHGSGIDNEDAARRIANTAAKSHGLNVEEMEDAIW